MFLTFTIGRKYNYINPCKSSSKTFPTPTSTKLINLQQHNIQIIMPIFIHILQNVWELWIEIEAALQSMAFIALILTKLSVIRFLWKHFVPNHIKYKDKLRKRSRKVNNDFTYFHEIQNTPQQDYVKIFYTEYNPSRSRNVRNSGRKVFCLWENYECRWVEFPKNYTCSKVL